MNFDPVNIFGNSNNNKKNGNSNENSNVGTSIMSSISEDKLRAFAFGIAVAQILFSWLLIKLSM